jgi:NADPH-dependent curcumin reductase CurA
MQPVRRIVLARRPVGAPVSEDFRLEIVEAPRPRLGEMLLETLWLSLDPYMRGRMSEDKSYAPPIAIGDPIVGRTISRVIESRLEGFDAGDLVVAPSGWQTHAVSGGYGGKTWETNWINTYTRVKDESDKGH